MFPSHAAAVMPLKLWRPRLFDGVAVVVGSTAPDLPYAVGAPLLTYGHTWVGLALWGVPLTVVAAELVRWSAPAVAAHLPGRAGEYGVLGRVRHRWYVTTVSAAAGAVTHRLWDDVTHDHLAGTSLGFHAPGEPLLPGVPWWVVLHGVSTAAGAAGWCWASAHIARRGLLGHWHGPPLRPPADPSCSGPPWRRRWRPAPPPRCCCPTGGYRSSSVCVWWWRWGRAGGGAAFVRWWPPGRP